MGSDVFNLALDALMVMAITGLWVMWFQQSAQRKKVERMLKDAAEDLKAATQLLDQVMGSLDMQQRVAQASAKNPVAARQQRQPSQDKVHQPLATKTVVKPNLEAVRKEGKIKEHAVDTAKIMRLSREGLNEQTIADQLKVPIAQVRLILLLQSPKK